MVQTSIEAGIFSRRAREASKSERTRARLLDAALLLYARNGWGRAAAHEITAAADLANGTFYRYFADRDAIDSAAAIGLAELTAAGMADALIAEKDARARVAAATRNFIEIAASQPWGRLLPTAIIAHPKLRLQITEHIRADVELGIAQGHFSVAVDQTLLDALGALVLAGLASRLNNGDVSAANRMAEYQLTLLGLSSDDARSFSSRR